MTQCWRLDTLAQSIILNSDNHQLPSVIYWGSKLPDDENLSDLVDSSIYDINCGSLDANPSVSVAPLHSDSFTGQAGLSIRDDQGRTLWLKLRFEREERTQTEDSTQLLLTFTDHALAITYQLSITADSATNMLIFQSKVDSATAMIIDWLAAPVLPAPQNSEHCIEFSGRWCGEFKNQQVAWHPGIRMRECRLGRTSHEHFPGIILPCKGTTNSSGQAFGLHYAWSGGHKMLAEELADGRRQIQFGHAGNDHLEAVLSAASAPLYATYSDTGLNGLATVFQQHVRQRIVDFPEASKPRPVHYNCWEAVYFDHDSNTLFDLAERAAKLGAERFVLDDGWFINRDDDTTSLGDWYLDKNKYPKGLTPLINHVQRLKMGFGLWFEPEMISLDSDLYRQHPQWLLGPKEQLLGRQQFVLDLSQTAVGDYLFERLSSLLTHYDIEYIKWDHNRVLPVVDARQTLALYALLDRLRDAHPRLEIESCASGGGRIDYAILKRTQRVWLSDSNDALERFWMQNNAALFLPSLITGSHIGPAQCHTSGRILPLAFRAWVAASRHMGIEMDPRELSKDDVQLIKNVTDWYKLNRHWLHNGYILRLDADDSAVKGELQIAADGSQFVAFIAQLQVSDQTLPRPMRLTGLAPNARYTIALYNPQQSALISRGNPALKTNKLTLSGRILMDRGILLPVAFPATLWVIEGKKL